MNQFRELLGLDLPLVLGPFGGVSSTRLAALVSERGGLGSFGLYGYDAQRIRSTAAELAALTSRPFALNLWLPLDGDHDVHPGDAEYAEYVERLRPYFDELGIEPPPAPARYLPPFEEQFEAVLEVRPAAVSFVFGAPPGDVVDRAHERGIVVLGAATTVDEAVVLEASGMDALVATGMEAGGHRPSFLRPAEESLVPRDELLREVVRAVVVPVVAAGGIVSGEDAVAALDLGASAVQVGSAFLATDQSAASPGYRALLREGDGGTVLTRGPSGRLARGMPNRLIRELTDPAPFPVQNWLTGVFRAVAAQHDRTDLLSLWAGEGAQRIHSSDANALLDQLEAAIAAR